MIGLPLAILTYWREQRRERENEEEEPYQLLSVAYADFLKLVIANPDLQLRSRRAAPTLQGGATMSFTRRRFLTRLATAGGASLAYDAITGLGLLATPAPAPFGLSAGSDRIRPRRRHRAPPPRDCATLMWRLPVSSNLITVALAALLIGTFGACGSSTIGIRTQFVGSYPFSATERRTIARIAGATTIEARRHLPALASQITLQVGSGKDVIPELGATGTAVPPDWVSWTVDPDNPQGVVKIAEAHLRGALFHEFHHLVRGTAIHPQTLMDHVVTEGLATAFERDFAGVSRPWADYPSDVSNWVDELLQQPPTSTRNDWMVRHPDGRRWIGMKAGTYLVDQAMKRLNRTSAELVTTPSDEVLAAARGQ